MRISDWSSDVCSSDLVQRDRLLAGDLQFGQVARRHLRVLARMGVGRATADALAVAGDQGEPVDLGDAVGQRVLAQIQRLEAPVERRGLRVQAQAVALLPGVLALQVRSEEHTSELKSLMRISYA